MSRGRTCLLLFSLEGVHRGRKRIRSPTSSSSPSPPRKSDKTHSSRSSSKHRSRKDDLKHSSRSHHGSSSVSNRRKKGHSCSSGGGRKADDKHEESMSDSFSGFDSSIPRPTRTLSADVMSSGAPDGSSGAVGASSDSAGPSGSEFRRSSGPDDTAGGTSMTSSATLHSSRKNSNVSDSPSYHDVLSSRPSSGPSAVHSGEEARCLASGCAASFSTRFHHQFCRTHAACRVPSSRSWDYVNCPQCQELLTDAGFNLSRLFFPAWLNSQQKEAYDILRNWVSGFQRNNKGPFLPSVVMRDFLFPKTSSDKIVPQASPSSFLDSSSLLSSSPGPADSASSVSTVFSKESKGKIAQLEDSLKKVSSSLLKISSRLDSLDPDCNIIMEEAPAEVPAAPSPPPRESSALVPAAVNPPAVSPPQP